MTQLTALDAAFLYAETAQTPMNLSTLHRLELPADHAGDFVDEVRTLIGKRLHLAPMLHRRLVQMPYDLLTPMWVEDDDVDLEHHIRHVTLQRPGGTEQLRALVGRLHSQQLDRSRPLWEIILIEGLEGGQWAAMVKVHHSGIDGQSGVMFNNAIMDLQPQPREVRPPRNRRRSRSASAELGASELLTIGVKNFGSQFVGLIRSLPQIVKTLKHQSQVVRASLPRLPGLGRKRDDADADAGVPRTPFNVSVTSARVWASARLPLADVKRVAKTAGASINDLLFALTAAGLRKYLQDGNELPDQSLVAMMPVSTRAPGDTDMSNKVSMASVRLHTELADPLAQLRAIAADTRAIKDNLSQTRGGIPTDLPIIGMPWMMSGMIDLVGRLNLAESLPLMGNLVISNFVAATTPMYFCGARVLTFSPVLILMHGQALGLAMQTYHDSIEIGATGCRRAMPDVGEIVDNIVAAFATLEQAVAAEAAKTSALAAPPRAAHGPAARASRKTSTTTAPKAVAAPRRTAQRQPAGSAPGRAAAPVAVTAPPRGRTAAAVKSRSRKKPAAT